MDPSPIEDSAFIGEARIFMKTIKPTQKGFGTVFTRKGFNKEMGTSDYGIGLIESSENGQ